MIVTRTAIIYENLTSILKFLTASCKSCGIHSNQLYVMKRGIFMSFANEMRKEANFTRTENGAVALNTTGDACLDLFSTIGSLRTASEERIQTLFAEAY